MKSVSTSTSGQSAARRWTFWIQCLSFLFVMVLASSSRVQAQALSGISGTVADTTGGVVGNAKVTVTNNATQVKKTTQTSSSGTYTVTDLIPGTYTVVVDMPGFQSSVHNGVGVDVGRTANVDATLQTGNSQQSIEVTEDVIALETTQPVIGTTIENKVVQELPVQISGGRGRQIESFIFLAPGVTGDNFSHRINGGVDFQNEVVYGGVPVASSETQGFQTIANPPFEMVNEFNVLRSSFSAQYGLAQGVITYNFASGTNQLHGDVFEIVRNEMFDARGAYNATRPVDKEHNYGFSVAGPVWIPRLYNGKNRTFFHLSMEWYRQNQTSSNFMSMPTAAQKQGDFSATGLTIFDPLTGKPFPNNTIPTSRFSPLSASLLPLIPDPKLSGYSNNLQSQLGVLPTRQNPWGFTIDHSITQNQTIHWSEWRNKQTGYGTETGSYLSNALSSQVYQPNLGTGFIATYSNTLSSHLVMTAGGSWVGELNNQLSNHPATFAASPGTVQTPGINFEGPLSPTTLGSPWTDSVNRKLGIAFQNNFLWIKGKHTLNIGWEMRRTYQDDNECQRCAGHFTFSNHTTADPNNLSTTGNSFASFLLGQVDSAGREGSNELRLRNFAFAPYVQDNIKITPRLTVNVGLRWDVMRPFTENDNHIVFFDSKILNAAAGGLPGAATMFGNCTGCAGFDRADIKWTHFGPRTGFSYALNKKTVLQGGLAWNYLDGGAYEYGTSKTAVNYGNLLLGSFSRNSTNSTTPAFGGWDSNVLPFPARNAFSPAMGIGTNIFGFNRGAGIAPYSIAWSFGVQRELPGDMLVSAFYSANRANFLPSQLNPINQLDPKFLALGSLLGLSVTDPQAVAAGIRVPYPNFVRDLGGSATVLQALRPYPQFSDIQNNFDNSGSALYNSLQVQAEKRYTSGLSFIVSYTLSRSMSNTNSGFTSFASRSLNKDNQKSEWSIDNNDRPQVLNIAGTYELPIGPGKRFLNTKRVVGRLLGGWQISPLLTYSNGTPLQVNVDGNPLGNGAGNRPNLVAGQSLQNSYSNVYDGKPVLNRAAFSDPGPWAIGNEPRYVAGMRSPMRLNENLAFAKHFVLHEKVNASFRVEFFNIFNRVVFGGPNTNLNDPNFGLVINSQDNRPRQGQAQFRIDF